MQENHISKRKKKDRVFSNMLSNWKRWFTTAPGEATSFALKTEDASRLIGSNYRHFIAE